MSNDLNLLANAARGRSVPAPATQARPVRSIPAYQAIVSGASWLGIWGGIIWAIGFVGILCGLVLIALAFHKDINGPMAIAIGVASCFESLVLLAFGACLKMMGSVGLAVRDIARNSYRQ